MTKPGTLECTVCAYVPHKPGEPCKVCKRMTSPERETGELTFTKRVDKTD